MDGIDGQKLVQAALDLGFSRVGIGPARPAGRVEAYIRWLERGFYGDMAYLARPDRLSRRQDLNVILPGVHSIISVGLDYSSISLPQGIASDPSRGRISNYAWGIDYHALMLRKLEGLSDKLAQLAGANVKSKAYVDTGAILERDHGESSWLGFTGKNTMLIAADAGSYFFLGQLLTTADLPPTRSPKPLPTCGTCHRCLEACPTGAFPDPYVLDARRCISYLTIELGGWIPRELRPLMGNWIYGCDICQQVCPFNRFSAARSEPGFFPPSTESAAPSLLNILGLSESEFDKRYEGSPIKRIKRRGLVRNACVAAGNWGSQEAVPVLSELLADPEPLVRGHAAWALGQIGGSDAVEAVQSFFESEQEDSVKGELSLALKDL